MGVRKYVRSRMVQRLIFQGLLLAAVQSGAHAESCPPSCNCTFFLPAEDIMAICELGDSTVKIIWTPMTVEAPQTTVTAICQDTGTNFTCADLPQFDIRIYGGKVIIQKCATSIMKCINNIYRQTSIIESIEVINLTAPYTADDFSNFNRLEDITIRLTDADRELPAIVINSLQSITKITIAGGNLQLHSNMFNQSRVNFLQLDTNNIKVIPEEAFNGLSSLKELFIEGNRIEEIHHAAFRGLNKLEILRLHNLRTKSIDSRGLLGISNISELYLYDMQLEHFPKDLLKGLKNLQTIYVTTDSNYEAMTLNLQVFDNVFITIETIVIMNCKINVPARVLLINIRVIMIKNSIIESLPPDMFSNLRFLQAISLSNNTMKILDEKLFSNTKDVALLDLSYNRIEIVSGKVFANNPKLKELYLMYNNISHVDLNAFHGMNLVTVDLSSNRLQRMVGKTVSWETIKLNLSDNDLSVFEDWFAKLKFIRYLDLTHNEIKTITENEISSFSSNVKIDLRHNKISNIKQDTNTKSLAPNQNVSLYLSNNPLRCNCFVIQVLKKWQEHGILADYEKITCVNGVKLSNVTHEEVESLCTEKRDLIGIVAPSTLGALLIIRIVILIYVRRKRFWKFISALFNRNSNNLTAYEMQQDSLKQYDLFISFAHEDGEFVADVLLPKLENDFGQKVCVHYRDWLVGDLIPDQIVQSVESSRMTVIILTEHFLESEWSYLEFRTAHNLTIQEGKPRVIVILMNEFVLEHEHMSDDLKSYLTVYTYLLWSDPNFWEKLQKVLPREGKAAANSRSRYNLLNLFMRDN